MGKSRFVNSEIGGTPLNDWQFGNYSVIRIFFHVFSYFLEGHACLPVRTWSTFPVDFPYLSPLVSLLKTTKEDLDDFKVSHYFKKPAHGCRKAGGSLVLWSSNYSWEDVVSWTDMCVRWNVWRGQRKMCGFQHSIRSLFLIWLSHGFPKIFGSL